MRLAKRLLGGATALATAFVPLTVGASSHREAPYITEIPKVDGTDFYLFNSYEPGREDYVTIIANYLPLQDPYGAPNYFALDPEALYEIHIDNNGDAIEDLTFQIDTALALAGNSGIALQVGAAGATKQIAVPFTAVGPITAADESGRNLLETYQVNLVRGPRRTGTGMPVAMTGTTTATFKKPFDYAGPKTFPDYALYAASFIHQIDIPGCTPPANTTPRLFVGQRREGFSVNVGQIFDTLNLQPAGTGAVANVLGPQEQGFNDLAGKNVTTIAIEVPKACLTKDAQTPIIAGWTTASMRQARVLNPTPTFTQPAREGGPWAQVSRLANPLVNEVVIGLKDKDAFNASHPKDDAQWADYVTHPTLPEVIELVYGGAGVRAPNRFPRTDLVAAFLTGVPMVNADGSTAELMRLNTAVPATPRATQVSYGAALCFDPATASTDAMLNLQNVGCDPAGFPNGRRPGDDVTDIEIRVAMGYLLNTTDAPAGQLPYVDGAGVSALDFSTSFPYLTTPLPGAP
ncbi:MAG: DUF4331 domain-containing protein [Myxococcota bacterium]|nr:DUF4331 domain-containing protein [Myxococcota bacterium]